MTNNFFISQTSFADLTAFLSLVCVPGIIQLVANPLLTNLNGLSNLQSPPQSFLVNGQTVGSVYQNLQDIAALAPVAACTGTFSAYGPGNQVNINYVLGNMQISSLTCYLASWNSVCSFLASGQLTCPNTELAPPISVPPPPPPVAFPGR